MKKLTVVFISLFLSHIATSADMREEAILDRVSSIASVCLKTEDCGIETSGPGYKVALNNPIHNMKFPLCQNMLQNTSFQEEANC